MVRPPQPHGAIVAMYLRDPLAADDRFLRGTDESSAIRLRNDLSSSGNRVPSKTTTISQGQKLRAW